MTLFYFITLDIYNLAVESDVSSWCNVFNRFIDVLIDSFVLYFCLQPGDFSNQLLAPGGKGSWGSWGKGSSGGTGAKATGDQGEFA